MITRLRSSLTAAAALALVLAPVPSRAQPAPAGQVAFAVLEDFSQRIAKYAALRAELQAGLPPLAEYEFDAVRSVELALAARIRTARRAAKQGELFTTPIATAFRKILREVDGETWKAITDEKVGVFPHRVNDSYPKTEALSTVPPNLLARLPPLPEGLQYRFVGGDLILHDTAANLIVDRIPEAISLRRPAGKRP